MAYHTSQILLAIQSLRPGLEIVTDFELSDLRDGNGPFIAVWNRDDITPPTRAEIEAVDTEALLAQSREAVFNADATRSDLLNRLRTATPQQISTYVDSNVTNLAEARALFKKILLVLAQ